MIFDNKRVLSIALGTALLGGTVGAFVSRSGKSANEGAATQSAATLPATQANNTSAPVASDQVAQNTDAYREGFTDGVKAVLDNGKAEDADTTRTVVERETSQPARVVYRNSRRGTAGASTARYDNSRRVYYDYEQPQKRSFWQKHRDKLTVAAGAGGGAILGGLIGGKKGAAIGALAGGGGSALYTYKLRKRNRTY